MKKIKKIGANWMGYCPNYIVRGENSSELGYCILGVAGKLLEVLKKKKKLVQGRNWTGGVGVATSFWCSDLAEVRTEGSYVAT